MSEESDALMNARASSQSGATYFMLSTCTYCLCFSHETLSSAASAVFIFWHSLQSVLP